jgi:class 3 adenylate cyclase/pimeloyl-ACP methyl ester carboxylesterase
MNFPETKYAMNGDLAVAYQVFGEGPRDVVFTSNFLSNVDAHWEVPEIRRWWEGMGTFARIIIFDQPGAGVSDPISLDSPPTLEQWVDSVRVVMDAAGSSEAVITAFDGGVTSAVLFAATYPTRTSGLVLQDGAARLAAADDYPFGLSPDPLDRFLDAINALWGTGELQHALNPDMPWNEEIRKMWARVERLGASPRVAQQMMRLGSVWDVREILPSIRCPTLVIHHADSRAYPLGHGQYLAEHIPNAKLVVVPGRNAYPLFDDWRAIIDEVQEFVTGTRGDSVDEDRMLATVLFTDIVDSTQLAAEKGDSQWRALLDAHDAIVRSQLGRFRGREVKTVGDGFLATFDGPQRAIKCALAIRETVRPLGIEVRAGLHTGECEIRGEDVGGIAVHIGARVASEAGPSEVLVSSTVKDLVVGSGIVFEDRGARALKGVPDEWRLFAVGA